MEGAAAQLETIVRQVLPTLRAVAESNAAFAPRPGAWSARQVLGHLIDSASNNHQRFLRAQFADDLVFPGYDQEEWVHLQGYQETAWEDLLELWAAYNFHLARVIARIPPEVQLRPRSRHNLDQLAWRPVASATPATLAYFIDDYVGHLKHHLCQIFDLLGLPPIALIAQTPDA